MFSIHYITLKDFKSYAGNHSFELPTKAGLYFITGDNQVEPRLESNGAGKSTILDAIYWCLYGKTLRGLKGSDVVTWGKRGCSVGLVLTIGQQRITITRRHGPNSLELNGKPVDQATLQKTILLTESSFVYAVIMPQFGQSFFELTPAEKLTLFSQIMGLDYWLDRSQFAASKASIHQSNVLILEQKIVANRESIKALEDDVATLGAAENTFTDENEKELHILEREMDEAELLLLALAKEKKEALKGEPALIKEQSAKMAELASVRLASEGHRKRQGDFTVEAMTINSKISDVKSKISKMGGLRGTCPNCQQEVDTTHLQAEITKLTRTLRGYEKAVAEANKNWEGSNLFVQKSEKNITKISADLASIEEKHKKISVTLNDIENEISIEKRSLVALREQAKAKKNSINPYVAMRKEKALLLKEAKSKGTKYTTELAVEQASYEATNFWVTGFKRLRLFLIEETLRALEVEVNSSLATLGLPDWRVEFDVERENKSGGITKGFVVFIRNSSHPEPVRLEAWSGGEAQRLQLAGDLGLANLIMLQAGLSNTIEFFDEPSKHLSRAGLLDLAETLHQRALNDSKCIFLIDHQTIDFGEFADTINITKTTAGSAFQ